MNLPPEYLWEYYVDEATFYYKASEIASKNLWGQSTIDFLDKKSEEFWSKAFDECAKETKVKITKDHNILPIPSFIFCKDLNLSKERENFYEFYNEVRNAA